MKTNLTATQWHKSGSTWARGYAFVADGQMLDASGLAAAFDTDSEQAWQQQLVEANGLFAIVRSSEHFAAAALSPSRPFPLYFRADGNELSLSDDPYSLIRPGDTEDPIGVKEYMASAAAIDGHTLVGGIAEVRPGFYVTADGIQHQFFDYAVRPEQIRTPGVDEALAVFERAFGRLLRSVGSRQIVVPLTSGLDSRIVVCMLKRLGHTNVLCYTAGRPGNLELEVASMVAGRLGFRWVYVDTTTPQMQSLVGSGVEMFERYQRYMGGLVSFVYLFEYVAVSKLRADGLLDDDTVFVPGHSLDLFAGSHLGKCAVSNRSSLGSMASAINYDINEFASTQKVEILTDIRRKADEGFDRVSVFTDYIVRNRLAHNIANSARAYDFYGYEVRLPFWDTEVLRLFSALPYEELYQRAFFRRMAYPLVYEPAGVDVPFNARTWRFYMNGKLRKRLKAIIPRRWLRGRIDRHDIVGEYDLALPLLRELVEAGVYPDADYPCSVNEVIKDYYLMRVRRHLHTLRSQSRD